MVWMKLEDISMLVELKLIGGQKKLEAVFINKSRCFIEKLPGLEFLTSKQLLLLGYGKSFCSNTKSKAREWQRKTDTHSPSHERINLAIKHLPMFKDIYQCSPESK